MIDTNILYATELTNLAPQRGFLISFQPYVMILDIDLNNQKEYNAKLLKDNNKQYLFIKDGPVKININQDYIQFNGDKDTVDYIQNSKFLTLKVKYLQPEPGVVAFKKFDFDFKQIFLEKEVKENSVIFKLPKELMQTLADESTILMTQDVLKINPSYDLYLGISKNKSENLYYEKGEDFVISYLENKFVEYKLSGNIYRTRNGLRVILTDKVRDMRDDFYRDEYIKLMTEMLTDRGIMTMLENKAILAKEDLVYAFGYPVRFTPKLKYYSELDLSYEKILDSLDDVKIQQYKILEESIPYKFDLKEIFYKENEKKNEFLDEGLKTLQNLIIKYLKNTKKIIKHQMI